MIMMASAIMTPSLSLIGGISTSTPRDFHTEVLNGKFELPFSAAGPSQLAGLGRDSTEG